MSKHGQDNTAGNTLLGGKGFLEELPVAVEELPFSSSSKLQERSAIGSFFKKLGEGIRKILTGALGNRTDQTNDIWLPHLGCYLDL